MLDNELIQIFRPILINGLQQQGFSNVSVQQADQPTAQGVPTEATVTFYKLSDKRYGFISNDTEYDLENEVMIQTQIQYYETMFQVSALLRQNPSVISYTASDLANICASIMQEAPALAELHSHDIGILRIGDVQNPYFKNDRDQNTASPSFDFIITHKKISVREVPIVSRENINIYRV